MSSEAIQIPEPLQRRIIAKNEALLRARTELDELIELSRELLNVPEEHVLVDVRQGFVPPSDAGSALLSES